MTDITVVNADGLGAWCYVTEIDGKYHFVAFECPLCKELNYVDQIERGERVRCSNCGVFLTPRPVQFFGIRSFTFNVADCGACYLCQSGYFSDYKRRDRANRLVKFLEQKLREKGIKDVM